MKKMTDQERLDFIKTRINYFVLKGSRNTGKITFINDLLWLIEKAEEGIRKRKKTNGK